MNTILLSFLLLFPVLSFGQAEGESSVILIYRGSEFLGYCLDHFETEDGDELSFINPDYGSYSDPDGMCGMKSDYLNKKFRVNYVMGIKSIYIEDVGDDETETKLITSITLLE